MRKKIKIAVLMGGKSPEYEVSCLSGKRILESLDPHKYDVFPMKINQKGEGYEKLFKLRPEVVFVAMHGSFGENGAVQGLLELRNIPYTGSGILASALGMDKIMFRTMVQKAKIAVPRCVILKKGDFAGKVWDELSVPVVVKPYCQGSSIGVSIVHSKANLEKALQKAFDFGSQAIVEEFLSGVEVTCGILGNDKPIALPVAEIIPKKEFFDYESKYVSGMSEEVVPARISAKLTKKIQETALKVYQLIGCCGFGRVDMILRQSTPYVLEINTIPGLTPNSLLPKEAAAAGITYQQLIEKIIQLALEKNYFADSKTLSVSPRMKRGSNPAERRGLRRIKISRS